MEQVGGVAWADRRTIILVGLPDIRKQMVGKALADRLGYVLPSDYSTEPDRFNNVYVPEDIRYFDQVAIEAFRNKSLMVFLDMPVNDSGEDRVEMLRSYQTSRAYFEQCAHTTVICQQKDFDVESTVDVLVKIWEKSKKIKNI